MGYLQEGGVVGIDPSPNALPKAQREGVYEAIRRRRDIRGQFLPDPVPEGVLARILRAAHLAPSVGFMQAWDFIVVRQEKTRQGIHAAFEEAHAREAVAMPMARRGAYGRIKLEGILEAPLNLCVTCDRSRFSDLPVGRTAQPDCDRYSVVCAVQNLWLAARAEGVGVGWVSIVDPNAVKGSLGIPEGVKVIAYLCMGYVTHFPERPELEAAGWLPRLPLERLVHAERWGADVARGWPELAAALGNGTQGKGEA
ncbi:MAG: 5,6-dimethylbenzimidazole synthase [Planctomycetes bacterium]|nr:5,6-dimethylbenzimidazole synthase [Planctomycetota bacterium]